MAEITNQSTRLLAKIEGSPDRYIGEDIKSGAFVLLEIHGDDYVQIGEATGSTEAEHFAFSVLGRSAKALTCPDGLFRLALYSAGQAVRRLSRLEG